MPQSTEQTAAQKQVSASLGLAANLHHFRAANNELPSHRITPATTAKLILQPSISINSGLVECPSHKSDADFMAVGVRYRGAALTLDHIKMLAAPKRSRKPEFRKGVTSSWCETRCNVAAKPPLRRSP